MTTLSIATLGFEPRFHYGEIPEALQNEAESLVSNIRLCLRKFNTQALDLTRRISHLREQFTAKQFRAWLSHYFPDAEEQIRNWLKIVELADRLPELVDNMMGWATSAIALLARGNDELVKTVLTSGQKLTLKAIETLLKPQKTPDTPQPSQLPKNDLKIPQQPSETALRLARLTLYKVQLEQELSEAVTGDAQAQLIHDIKQTEREIKHQCAHLDPQTIVIPPQPQSTPTDDLEAALATERQKNAELIQKLEHLEQKLSQTYLQQLEQLQTQLQHKDELIAQLQQPTSSPDNEPTVFKPKFVPVPLSELKVGDRIRVYSPEHKGVVDDLILELDTYNRPKTKWLGVLDQNDVKAGWTFERMSGVEQAQSQLSLLKSENQHLKQQLAQQQQHLETLLSEPGHVRLEQTSTTEQLEAQLEELLQWRESLNQQIQPHLQPGVQVRVNFDPKNIFTGMQGTIHKAYQQRPGYWWVSIIHPVSGQTYQELFEPCQLQPLV
ncbi:hypothetical protein [Planktothrix agardhii]|uniref:hypothetical protein n=1 Tax=Planktothrix agardhii TaxID=1160 RepID=UPI0020A7AD0C|nr:hypothetical protein [Planktothrix agardhii]CAD5911381.1 hypothetical protein NO758_00063 [Planktothrix agardhii]